MRPCHKRMRSIGASAILLVLFSMRLPERARRGFNKPIAVAELLLFAIHRWQTASFVELWMLTAPLAKPLRRGIELGVALVARAF